MSEEAAHSPLGPSSAERWLNCTASVAATKDLPDTDSDYALEGTAAHTLAEKCRELDQPASKFLGHIIDVRRVDGSFKEFVVNQEMADAVQMFIDHVNDLPGMDFNEMRVRYDEYVKHGFGTLDAARANDGTIYIRDLKYGKGVQVFAKENEQLMLYALGFYLEYGHLFEIEKFNVGIVQPRLDHVDTWEIDVGVLLQWAYEVVKPKAEETMKASAKFVPGEWCRFCKLKATCKARADSIFTELVDDFDEIPDAVEKIDKLQSPVGKLTNAEIALILPKLGPIKAWCKDIESYAFRQLSLGQAVGDMKLVEGKSNREFVPGAAGALENAVIDAHTEAVYDDGLLEGLYEPKKLKSPAQIEKLLGKKRFAPATQKKPAGDLAHLVVKPKGRPVMVGGDDPRPPIVVDPGSEFEEIGED